MNYTYPSMLWGMFALLIPIIVHLFNFRKAKKIKFTNVRFLESIKKNTTSNLQLKHLLILAMRLFFTFFLILTFAQPFVPSTEEGLSQDHVVLYIDNSNSMSGFTSQGISAFNESLNLAEKIIGLYPSHTLFTLVTNDFSSSASRKYSKTKILEELANINYSPVSRTGQEIFLKLKQPITNSKDVFVISDFQVATMGQLDMPLDSTNYYYIVPISVVEQRNISIDTLFLANPFLVPTQSNKLQVRLRNHGTTAIAGLNVKFYINDQLSGIINVDIKENAIASLTFELGAELKRSNACKISFEDFPVTFDNEFYFVVNQTSQIKIVEIKEVATQSAIESVYADNLLFKFATFHTSHINYQTLAQADLVIINSVKNFGLGLSNQVEQLLQKRKSIVIIPSLEEKEVLGVKLVSHHNTSFEALKIPDINHPFFKGIFERVDNESLMPSTSIRLTWDIDELPLLTTKTGRAFFTWVSTRGQLYLFASPIDNQYTQFHQHSLFVPVMHRIAELSSSTNNKLFYTTDESSLAIRTDSIASDQLYKLKQGEKELIPTQNTIGNQLWFNIPKYLLLPGFYDFTLNTYKVGVLAFNTPKEESEQGQMPTEALHSKLSNIKNIAWFDAVDTASLSEEMGEKYHDRKLWKYTLTLSLLFLLIESLLLRFL